MYRCLAALVAALLVFAGCGETLTVTRTVTATVPPVTYLPPESAVTPDGAKPQAPPQLLSPGVGPVRHISVRGLHLIEGFEGFSSCPYYDSVGTGHPYTRGYGETEGIHPSSPCISRAQGERNLQVLVERRYEWALRGLGVVLNQNQWDALDSFVWNLGAGIFQGTTLGADLRAGQFGAAAASMLRYDRAGGVVLAGLRRRREVEVRLFVTPVSKPRPDYHKQIVRAYRTRRHLRRVLLEQHCRVPHPTVHCRGVLRTGARVNRQIRALHAHHIY